MGAWVLINDRWYNAFFNQHKALRLELRQQLRFAGLGSHGLRDQQRECQNKCLFHCSFAPVVVTGALL